MPELPEVETIRRSLEDRVRGRRVLRAEFRRTDILKPDPRTTEGSALRNAARTEGATIFAIGRRGKHLLLEMDGGWGWTVGFGMTGSLILEESGGPEEDHTHVVWSLEGGASLRFRDPRRFGYWGAAEIPPVEGVLEGRVGVDALDPALDASGFADLLRDSRVPIKCRLLDQRLVAGLGNIYVDEILFASRVNPCTPARDLDPGAWGRLFDNTVRILEAAVANRGTTFSDYRDGTGEAGGNQEHLAVYGRGGSPCNRCGAEIVRMTFRGRGTHLCPDCQDYNAKGGGAGA